MTSMKLKDKSYFCKSRELEVFRREEKNVGGCGMGTQICHFLVTVTKHLTPTTEGAIYIHWLF